MSTTTNQKAYSVVADPSEPEEREQTPSTKAMSFPNPFAVRPVSLIREFVVNGMREWPVEPISEAPSAESMARLTSEVMGLTTEQLASVLRTPVGAVSAWLDPESGSHPTPETASEPPEWTWTNGFLRLWALAMWWEKERDRQGERA